MADERLAVGRLVDGTTPAIPSATTIVARDGSEGLEVFMLERHIQTDFAGGAYVFPGGKVDEHDRALDPDRWFGIDPEQAAGLLGTDTPQDALGLYVAAVRETFEEAGVLLATRDGRRIDADALASDSFVDARTRLNERGERWDWRPWLRDERLMLDLGALTFFAWWATPDGLHRRYDTRFFVTTLPEEQEALLRHDDVETTASRWVRPEDALADGREGRATIVYPTRKNLEVLATYATADELAAAAAAGRTDRRRLKPVIVEVDGRTMIQHPDGGEPESG